MCIIQRIFTLCLWVGSGIVKCTPWKKKWGWYGEKSCGRRSTQFSPEQGYVKVGSLLNRHWHHSKHRHCRQYRHCSHCHHCHLLHHYCHPLLFKDWSLPLSSSIIISVIVIATIKQTNNKLSFLLTPSHHLWFLPEKTELCLKFTHRAQIEDEVPASMSFLKYYILHIRAQKFNHRMFKT